MLYKIAQICTHKSKKVPKSSCISHTAWHSEAAMKPKSVDFHGFA